MDGTINGGGGASEKHRPGSSERKHERNVTYGRDNRISLRGTATTRPSGKLMSKNVKSKPSKVATSSALQPFIPRTRLPWLDGSRSVVKPERQPSTPVMPGSFLDDRTHQKPTLKGKPRAGAMEMEDYPPRGRSLKRNRSPVSPPQPGLENSKDKEAPDSTKQAIIDTSSSSDSNAARREQADANATPVTPHSNALPKSSPLPAEPYTVSSMEAIAKEVADLTDWAETRPSDEDIETLLAEATEALKKSTDIQRQQQAEIARVTQVGAPIKPAKGHMRSPSSSESSDCSSDTCSECAALQPDVSRRPTLKVAPTLPLQPRKALVGNHDDNPSQNKIGKAREVSFPAEADWAFERSQPGQRRSRPSINCYNEPRRRSAPPSSTNEDDFYSDENPQARSSKQPKVGSGSRSFSAGAKHRNPFRSMDGDDVHSPRSLTLESPPVRQQSYGRAPTQGAGGIAGANWGRDKYDEKDFMSDSTLKGRSHLTIPNGETFSVHHRRRHPVSRNWSTQRKRFTAFMACINTMTIGLLIGIYAGEVPAIQYALVDTHHIVILGNVFLYVGLAITTFFFWSLPLLHGRKPYTLLAFALALPLQFPQALIVGSQRDPAEAQWRAGLLLSRAATGVALGFAHINCKTTLLDLFGSSLQSSHPHGEVVVLDDIRRHGGGMGLWLGFWSWCFIASLAIGFMVGAEVVSAVNVSWGFYIGIMLIALILLLNVLTPETRRASNRRTVQEIELPNTNIETRLARGEVKMHCFGDGPKHWWEECSAGVYLQLKMLDQPGFLVLSLYLGWIYGEVILIIVVLGNLLSTEYRWRPDSVGLGVFGIAVGALLSLPDTKANIFSKSRTQPQRTDSMTLQPRISWTSHLVRRTTFMIVLPIVGIGYTFASEGRQVHYAVPIILAGIIGCFSLLAIAECHGLIMETFDTSDLQPGVNSRHRLQSLPLSTKRKRTGYSSYPRVTAGLFVSQTFGFLLAAVATGVGGAITRAVGAQKATGITAAVLFFMTILLTIVLWRLKTIQVIPDQLFGALYRDRKQSAATTDSSDWRAVIIGNPSGKYRRMSLLELGGLSRWTEIRRLNRLLNRRTTQALNEGWR